MPPPSPQDAPRRTPGECCKKWKRDRHGGERRRRKVEGKARRKQRLKDGCKGNKIKMGQGIWEPGTRQEEKPVQER